MTIYCLNPTPPTISSFKTFACSTDAVRDQYDVYNYATLHVPMGCAEAYSSAYEWRYFNKIKDDAKPSAVSSMSLQGVKVTGYHGEINILNIDEPSPVSIYTLDGKLVNNIPSAFGDVRLSVPSEQVYVVKVGARSYKIAM